MIFDSIIKFFTQVTETVKQERNADNKQHLSYIKEEEAEDKQEKIKELVLKLNTQNVEQLRAQILELL